MDTREIAAQFVDLVMKYRWDEVESLLPESEMMILLDIVTAAGYEQVKMELGKLVGDYLNEDGNRTGKTYPINSFCPFKVVSEGCDLYFATGWFDSILRLVLSCSPYGKKSREKIIQNIVNEIERSVPLKPIQLSDEGDMLLEYPPSAGLTSYFVEHTRDEHELSTCVGVHEYCCGWFDRGQATKTHDAILCRSCHLRVLLPKKIKTYGGLRRFMDSKFAK